MPANIMTTGSGPADSSDVVVDPGDELGVGLKGAAWGAVVNISIKDDGGAYVLVDGLTQGSPATVLKGGFTYRFSRVGTAACGVFSG